MGQDFLEIQNIKYLKYLKYLTLKYMDIYIHMYMYFSDQIHIHTIRLRSILTVYARTRLLGHIVHIYLILGTLLKMNEIFLMEIIFFI